MNVPMRKLPFIVRAAALCLLLSACGGGADRAADARAPAVATTARSQTLSAAASEAAPTGNCVYAWGTSTIAFPSDSNRASNYWVDVVFTRMSAPIST